MPDPSTAERSLADEPTETVTAPTGSPLGTPNPAPRERPDAPAVVPPVVSIVDNILELNDYMSADVRRAEKTARFCSKPWLEAEIDELVYELESLTDDQGIPIKVEDGARDAVTVALEIQTKQAEMGAAFVSVRMGQLPSDDWGEFKTKWRAALDKGAPYPNDFYDELIGESSLRPKITAAQSAALRKKLGDPQMDELASKAWVVNAESGVSIPKSPLSSLVLRRAVRAQS